MAFHLDQIAIFWDTLHSLFFQIFTSVTKYAAMAVNTLHPLAVEEIHEQLNIAIQVFHTENQI